MKLSMIYPDISSEKGISNYSIKLIESIKKQGMSIDRKTFIARKPLSLYKNISSIKNGEIIHIQHEYNLLGGFGLPYFILYPYLYFKRTKIITTMHTVLSQKEKFQGNKLKTLLRKILYKTQNFWINRFSEKIIVHAEFFKSILVKEYGSNKNKIEIIPQGIIEGIESVSKEKAKKELNLKGNVYLIIGSFVPDHGADIVIQQAKKIGKTILIVTNPGFSNDGKNKRVTDFLERCENMTKNIGAENIVRFDLKELPFDLWWKYFVASDLVLLPYRGGIGSGIFSDAIAMNIPMVGSDIPYFKEYAKKYNIIVIAKNNDFYKGIKVAMNKKNYNMMKLNQIKYLKQYGLNSIGKIYKNLYASIK